LVCDQPAGRLRAGNEPHRKNGPTCCFQQPNSGKNQGEAPATFSMMWNRGFANSMMSTHASTILISGSNATPALFARGPGAENAWLNSKHGGLAQITVGRPYSEISSGNQSNHSRMSNNRVCGTPESIGLFSIRTTDQWGSFANASEAPPNPLQRSRIQSFILHTPKLDCKIYTNRPTSIEDFQDGIHPVVCNP